MNLVKKQTIKNVAVSGKNFFLYPKLILFLSLLTVGSLATKIYFSNQLAISGAKISFYEARAQELQEENYQLENRLSQLSSLSYIETKAVEMGMVKTPKLEVIKAGASVALSESN